MADEAKVVTPVTPISFLTEGVQFPTFVYINEDEYVGVEFFSSAVFEGRIKFRVLRPDGVVQMHLNTVFTDGLRTPHNIGFPMGIGMLLGAVVSFEGSGAQRGEVYCKLFVRRSRIDISEATQMLCAGYVGQHDQITFPSILGDYTLRPPGAIKLITGADPAAGAEISVTVPANTAWLVRAVRFTLVTSAAGANRLVKLTFDNGATVFASIPAQAVQTATLTADYNAGENLPQAAPVSNHYLLPIPTGLLLKAGFRIRTATDALDAGDNFSAPQLLVEEWMST